ncbi:trihelix transcription factor ASR3-like [Ananas comosus]|uniref:Trihelix transcription factor ASR3-like n=1 Tax=Ananas comosus TaxID=4615 RepID=A0A6P5FIN5_ANACO|nr:trihelix transcription factor ASR3-like [Ananas comosus]
MQVREMEREEHEKSREYRRGNWSLNETMVLIEAKKMDNERRLKRVKESEERMVGSSSSTGGNLKQPEMRWKWVEDYCWRYGCHRSQNQCNDRWDNLMRDYKKVRAYELSLRGQRVNDGLSYWKLNKHERKERNLPSNMLLEIYEALVEVVERKGGEDHMGTGGSASKKEGVMVKESQTGSISPLVPLTMQLPSSSHGPQTTMIMPPPPPPPHPTNQTQPLDSVDSDDNDHSNSSTERKRRREEGPSTSSARTKQHSISSSISKSASILAAALQASEEREESRHRDLMILRERAASLEQSKSEISSQSMEAIATAINKLASSILGLVSDRASSHPK